MKRDRSLVNTRPRVSDPKFARVGSLLAEPRVTARTRRALSHVGGALKFSSGTPDERDALAHALSVEPDESATLAHVHGFHSYPARLHPETARRLIEGFSDGRERVLDPFCGSGTVLVEARLLGRRAFGIDASPLAVELSGLKAEAPGAPFTQKISATAQKVAERADERRKARAGALKRYGEDDLAMFVPHVLLELDGLRDGILALSKGPLQRALLLVLSACLTKLSRRGGDTTHHATPKRIAGGFAARFFADKARDLETRLVEVAALLPANASKPEVALGDARRLNRLGEASIDLVVTSPPYPGVYDYLEHQRARLRWLGFDAHHLESHEIGARRHARRATFAYALTRFRSELGQVLAELGRVLVPGGAAVLVSADSVLGGRAVRSDRVIADLARAAGLDVAAVASQARPHFHAPTAAAFRDEPRYEHAVLLRARR